MNYDGTDQYPNDPKMERLAEQGLNRIKPRTRLERLKDAKRGLEQKLKEINDAIEALEANPEINRIMELVEKAGV